jgi:hypothetical protein
MLGVQPRSASVPFFMQLLLTPKSILPTAPSRLPRCRNCFFLQPRREVFFDRRDQFSASAIQRFLLAGSRFASFMHSEARAPHSIWLDISTPCLRVDLILANLRQVPFSGYCPQGHCPNGQVGSTERSGAARADAESDYPDDDRSRGCCVPLIWIKTDQAETQRHASLPCSMHNGETLWNRI